MKSRYEESATPGSYVEEGKRWLLVAGFYDEEAWYTLKSPR